MGLAIVAIALITGPYGWAVTTRRRTSALARSITSSASDPARQESTVVWVRAHREALQLGGGIVFILLLLILNLSWVGFLLVAALVALFEIWLARLGVGNGNDEVSGSLGMPGDAPTSNEASTP